MASPADNLLQSLLTRLQTPQGSIDGPIFPEGTPASEKIMAGLLAQAFESYAPDAPTEVASYDQVLTQLAGDLGIPEQDMEMNLQGLNALLRTGAPNTGSLLTAFAADHGMSPTDARMLLQGNAALATMDAKDRAASAPPKRQFKPGAFVPASAPVEERIIDTELQTKTGEPVPTRIPLPPAIDQTDRKLVSPGPTRPLMEPTKDEVLEGLLAEARGVTERNDPDAKAAFENKLGRLMRSPDVTPAEKEAAYQLRHPDMHVEMQPDGIMSFSDKGPGLRPKDEATRRAVENVRARLTTLSPNQAIVAGEGSNIAALSAANRQKISDRAIDAKAKLFGAPATKAMADIQSTLQGIVNIDDPNERYLALQRLGPSIAAYGNQRRAEIRNDVFNELGIHELERSLAEQEARDRADPRWDEFQRDSPYTASLRAQVRQIKTDALVRIDEQLKSDPMLNTLRSQTEMTEALVRRLDEKDMNYQLPDVIDSMSPDVQTRTKAAVKALNPGANVDSMGSSELAKIMKTDPGFYEQVVALGDGNESTMIASMVLDSKNSKKWRSYIKQLELEAGADEATAEALTKDYVNYANSAHLALTGGMKESELKQQGGAVVQLVERWEEEKKTLSETDAVRRMNSYYIPKIIEAKLDYRQTQFIDEADRVIKDLKPETGNDELDAVLAEAKEKGFALGDLLDYSKLATLESSNSTMAAVTYGGAWNMGTTTIGLLEKPENRQALASYIATRRKERMLRTAFFEPLDTQSDVLRKLNTMVVTRGKPNPLTQRF